MRTARDTSDDGNNNNGGRGQRDGKYGGFFLPGNSESESHRASRIDPITFRPGDTYVEILIGS